MRMLIVDDDEITCLGIQMRVREMEFRMLTHIDVAFSAEAALQYAQTWTVDILLTDIRMVNMNGLELIEKMKTLNPDLSAIIITAYAAFDYARRAIQLGVKEFLLKPFSKEQLSKAILEIVQGSFQDTSEPTERGVQRKENPVLWAKQYVSDHMEQELNMAYIANALDMSYSYFSRLFKQTTGMTFSNYVLQVKMTEAVRLLKRGYKTSEVAQKTGYPILANFTRAFVRYWHCSPTDYKRKRIKGGL